MDVHAFGDPPTGVVRQMLQQPLPVLEVLARRVVRVEGFGVEHREQPDQMRALGVLGHDVAQVSGQRHRSDGLVVVVRAELGHGVGVVHVAHDQGQQVVLAADVVQQSCLGQAHRVGERLQRRGVVSGPSEQFGRGAFDLAQPFRVAVWHGISFVVSVGGVADVARRDDVDAM